MRLLVGGESRTWNLELAESLLAKGMQSFRGAIPSVSWPQPPRCPAHLARASSASPDPGPFVPELGIGQDLPLRPLSTRPGPRRNPRSLPPPRALLLAAQLPLFFFSFSLFLFCLNSQFLFTHMLEMAFLFCTNSCTFTAEI